MQVQAEIRRLGRQLGAALIRPIELPSRRHAPLDDELSQDVHTQCADSAPPEWAARTTSRRRLIVLIAGLFLLDALVFERIIALLTWSNDALFLDPLTTLVGLGCLFVLLRAAWAWASEPASRFSKTPLRRHRVSMRTLMAVVAAAALAFSLIARVQKLRIRARYYATMEARCLATAIRPYSGSSPIDIDELAKEYGALKERYAAAAWHPWFSVESRTEEAEARVIERSPALFQLENQAARWAGLGAEARRRLASRGRQFGRVTGPHYVGVPGPGGNYVLSINADDTFNFWQTGQHEGRYLGTGFAELEDGTLLLDFVAGSVQAGTRDARALEQVVTRVEELIKLRALDAPKE